MMMFVVTVTSAFSGTLRRFLTFELFLKGFPSFHLITRMIILNLFDHLFISFKYILRILHRLFISYYYLSTV